MTCTQIFFGNVFNGYNHGKVLEEKLKVVKNISDSMHLLL